MRNFLALFLIFTFHNSFSQQKYLVYFTDKDNTPFSINQPLEFLSQKALDRRIKQNITIQERDLPPNPNYIDSLKIIGANVIYKSKWFNAVFLEADSALMIQINNLGFVLKNQVLELPNYDDNIEMELEINANQNYLLENKNSNEFLKYGLSSTQIKMIGADAMHNIGYHGENMQIAVLDNGFSGVEVISPFQQLREEDRIISTYDFVRNKEDVYTEGSHGTSVLSTMAAELEQQIYGTAFKASYHLFITENNAAELLDEEVYWLIAAEHADSLGVDLINTSLGYNLFDNNLLNHSYSDLDGKTTIISKASEIAATTGMLLVTSAGNSGANSWHYITAPGDADFIITAGAVNIDKVKTSFSSVGPTADGRIKPDLCALGEGVAIVRANGDVTFANGTSFSSPLLCGLAAGFWQAHPELTAQEVIDYLKQSATQNNNPDTLQGWGIPDFRKAHVLAGGELDINDEVNQELILYPNPSGNNSFITLITLNSISKIILTNILGEVMFEVDLSKTNKNKYNISIADLPKGQYLLNCINNNNSSIIKKVIIN